MTQGYMREIKKEIDTLVKITKLLTIDTGMYFVTDKCSTFVVKRGKESLFESIVLGDGVTINQVEGEG